jgi:exopolysaccharide production protein ExoQ
MMARFDAFVCGSCVVTLPSQILTALLVLLPLLGLLSAMAMTPALLIVAVMLAVAVGPRALRDSLAGEGRWFWLSVLSLCGWAVLSALWSITPAVSAVTGLRVAVLMGFGAVAFILCPKVTLPPRAALLMVAVLCICIAALVTEFVPGGGVLRWAHGALGLDYNRFIDKNINRGLCALVILCWPAMAALHAAGLRRWALALPLILAVPVLGFDSRSAQLALGVGLMAFYAVRAAPQHMPRILAVVIPVGLLAWPVLFPVLDRNFFTDTAVYNALPSTAQHRVEIWRFVIERITERPWLGWGMDTSRAMPGGDVVYDGARKYLPLHPHNSALQVLLELGVVGFVLTVGAIALALRRWSRPGAVPAHTQAIAAAMIAAYLAIGFTAFGVWQYWWIALGWLGAVLWRASSRAEFNVYR